MLASAEGHVEAVRLLKLGLIRTGLTTKVARLFPAQQRIPMLRLKLYCWKCLRTWPSQDFSAATLGLGWLLGLGVCGGFG